VTQRWLGYWLKWRILVITLPFTVLFCSSKWIVHSLRWEVWISNSLTQSLFAASTLVIAFILGGTLADYRESEGIPARFCSAIEAIQDSNQLTAGGHPDYDPKPVLNALLQILHALKTWLREDQNAEQIYEAIAALNTPLVALEQFTSAPLMSRIQAEQAMLRLLVMQIQSSRDVNFVAPAYLLAELFVAGAVSSLLLIEEAPFIQNLILSGLIVTALVYLLALIRDLDNPFQYTNQSSADVTLFILEETSDRLSNVLKSASIS